MMNAWDEVRAAIDAEDAAAVATLVAGFDDTARKEVAHELPGHLLVARAAGRHRTAERESRRRARWAELEARAARMGRSIYMLDETYTLYIPVSDGPWRECLRVAGAGVLPGAAAVVTWLGRRDLDSDESGDVDEVPLILKVVAGRPAAWQRDLAVRLALRLRGTRAVADRRARLALELLRRTGAEPPEHDPLTLAWVAAASDHDPAHSLTDVLAGDPLLNAMTPRLFRADGAGRLLRGDRDWPAALSALAADGRLSRRTLLDGCRTRFLLGGQAADQRFFVRLHERLDPSAEEIVPHGRDYLAVLPSAPSNVASLALKRIRRLGPVPPDQAGEAVEALLFRPEGALVRAGLTWLDRLLKDPARDPDPYAPALAAALTCASDHTRERAVTLALKHATRFGPLGAQTIRDAVATLPAHQGARLAEIFGGEAAEPGPESRPERFVPVPLPPVPAARPMPPLVDDADVLARLELPEYDWLSSELWLDGFVRLAARHLAARQQGRQATGRQGTGPEQDRLITALAPLAASCQNITYRWHPWWHTADWAAAMARELIEPGAERTARPDGRLTVAERVPEMTHGAADRLMPLARYAEAYQALAEGRLPPYLLSTPTRANGVLDPDALVERLEGYERDGVTALPLDLRQALLRLGRTVTPDAAARAARLTGDAGRRVARWLTDRPADPQVVLRWTTHQDDTRITSEFISGPEHQDVLGDLLVPRFHDESCERLLAVLAGHRELAAARAAWTLQSFWPLNKPKVEHLELLATAEGPAGPGMALLLAHYLLRGPGGGAVRPLLHLAATGDLPGEEVGRQLATLLGRSGDSPADAVAALRQAAEQGAHREVWQIMAGLLPAYLPGPGERATIVHTRLMRFAADMAEWADARGGPAVVAELAALNRASELVRQARRLHDQLSRPAPTPEAATS